MAASRIANVSAAVLASRGARNAAWVPSLMRLFEDVFWVGDPPPGAGPVRSVAWPGAGRAEGAGLAAAIAAARGERVIVVGEGDPRTGAEVLLALVAWPEAAVVRPAPGPGGDPPTGIYRRADLLARAEAVLQGAAPAPTLEAFVEGLAVERVPIDRLGLADAPLALFAGAPVAPRARS